MGARVRVYDNSGGAPGLGLRLGMSFLAFPISAVNLTKKGEIYPQLQPPTLGENQLKILVG